VNTPDINVIMWLIIAVMNGLNLYYTRTLEKNTNSKMDKVIQLTAALAEAKGRSDMQKETRDRAGDEQ